MTIDQREADLGPMTDSEIEAASVGVAERPAGAIDICDYDPDWPIQFERQAVAIHAALGARVVALHHAGSTAVPNLAAKPVLDIVVTVPDSADEAAYAPALEALGYELKVREPEWFEHRMFKLRSPLTNLHVFSKGCPEVDRMLLFRDWLRANADDRALYEGVKRRLADERWTYVQNYADAKNEVVREIVARAADRSGGKVR